MAMGCAVACKSVKLGNGITVLLGQCIDFEIKREKIEYPSSTVEIEFINQSSWGCKQL